MIFDFVPILFLNLYPPPTEKKTLNDKAFLCIGDGLSNKGFTPILLYES